MRYISTALATLLAAPLAAQDGVGTITGTLDLDPARWSVVTAGEGPQSRWQKEDAATRIRLVGQPESEGAGDTGTLIINMDVAAGVREARAIDARVELDLGDESLFAEDPNYDLSITAYRLSGDELAIAGNLVATLTPKPTDELIVEPPAAGMTFDGNFQATITAAGQDD